MLEMTEDAKDLGCGHFAAQGKVTIQLCTHPVGKGAWEGM